MEGVEGVWGLMGENEYELWIVCAYGGRKCRQTVPYDDQHDGGGGGEDEIDEEFRRRRLRQP